jgi:hypothetical protein
MVAESYNRMSQHESQQQGNESFAARYQHAAEQTVQEYPLAITLGAFAIGLGLGAAIGASLARSNESSRNFDAEQLGRKVLDAISEYMPSTVQKYLG